MKRKLFIISIAMLSLSIVIIAAVNISSHNEPCKNEKYMTAEPGTCLDPRAYRFIHAIERIENNPYQNDLTKKVVDFFEPKVHKTLDTIVGGKEYDVPMRIYYPNKYTTKNPTPVIMFIHGGGFIFGSIEDYDMAVKKLARVTGKIIVSVNYRLAPEHPYPAALNDVERALDWIIKNLDFIGGKGSQICIMGDSAGANLATVLSIKGRNENKDHIRCQVLLYPPTTFEEVAFPSREYFLLDDDRTYMLTEAFVRKSKESYLTSQTSVSDPYVSPLRANLNDKLPPALIINAQVDPLRDDGRLYAKKLKEAGQEVAYLEYPGIIHGFFNFYMIFDEAKQSMKKVRDFVETHFQDNNTQYNS